MHHRTAAVALVLLALGGASAARAQSPGRFAVWVGTGRLESGFSRAVVGSAPTLFGGSLPATFAEAQLSPELGRVSLDLDLVRAARSGSSVTGMALMLTERIPMGRAESVEEAARKPYFGLGFGLAQVRSKARVTIVSQEQTTTTTLSDSKIGIGIKAVVGISLGQNLFVEAGYRGLGKALNLSADSMGVTVGTRF